jgi:uncharacterized protein YhfF
MFLEEAKNMMVKRIQFVSDHLIEQIIEKRKLASVTFLENLVHDEDDYNQTLVVGDFYEVYDSKLVKRCTIRITAIELCQWKNIPERLWRGETNKNSDEFREDHKEYFNYPSDSFEFAAYYFQLVKIYKT